MIELRELVAAALRLQQAWQEDGTPFCFIGGLAVQRWSEPRFTRHVDATIFVGFGGERAAAVTQLQRAKGRIQDPIGFAILNRVLLLEDSHGCPIDLALGAMPFEQEMIQRSQSEVIDPNQPPIRICSASDLVILKAFAGRPQDWIDIRGTLIRSKNLLDWSLIQRELDVLLELKEEPESMERLLSLKTASNKSPQP